MLGVVRGAGARCSSAEFLVLHLCGAAVLCVNIWEGVELPITTVWACMMIEGLRVATNGVVLGAG